MNHELTCINCPLGCSLHVTEDKGTYLVTGNNCPRGEKYAISELTAPKRFVTSTVVVRGGEFPLVSVKTKEAIPKDKISLCMKAIEKLSIMAPVDIGNVLKLDIAHTGVPLVATGNVKKC